MKCTKRVSSQSGWNFNQCSRNEWKDGFCKQHHPESVKKRDDERAVRCEEKRKRSPHHQLVILAEKHKALKEKVEDLILVIGDCKCAESYTKKNLCDPACHYHLCKNTIVSLKKVMGE